MEFAFIVLAVLFIAQAIGHWHSSREWRRALVKQHRQWMRLHKKLFEEKEPDEPEPDPNEGLQ